MLHTQTNRQTDSNTSADIVMLLSVWTEMLLDAFSTMCSKCSPSQKSMLNAAVQYIHTSPPDQWKQLLAAYDPDGKKSMEFAEFLRKPWNLPPVCIPYRSTCLANGPSLTLCRLILCICLYQIICFVIRWALPLGRLLAALTDRCWNISFRLRFITTL